MRAYGDYVCVRASFFRSRKYPRTHFPHMSHRNISRPPQPTVAAANINCVPDLELCMYVWDLALCVCTYTVCVFAFPLRYRRDSVPMIEAVSATAGAGAVCTLANHLLSRIRNGPQLNAAKISKITIFSLYYFQ